MTAYDVTVLVGLYLMCAVSCACVLVEKPYTRNEIIASGIWGILWPVAVCIRIFAVLFK